MAETPQLKEYWLMDLAECRGEGRAPPHKDARYVHEPPAVDTPEAPVWVPDKETPICMVCGVTFTVFRRRHHCRNCGKVVCGACSAQRRVIPGLDMQQPERVCKFCYDLIGIEETEKLKRKVASPPLSPVAPPDSSSHDEGEATAATECRSTSSTCSRSELLNSPTTPVITPPAVLSPLATETNTVQQQQEEEQAEAAATTSPCIVVTKRELDLPPPQYPAPSLVTQPEQQPEQQQQEEAEQKPLIKTTKGSKSTTKSLKRENKQLRTRVAVLEEENAKLRQQLHHQQQQQHQKQ